MNEEKAPLPSYMGPPQPHATYIPPEHPSYTAQAQGPQVSTSHEQQQNYGSPQGQTTEEKQQQPPQRVGSVGGVGTLSGYPPDGQTPLLDASAGQQYQQQLFAMCAAGNHDVTTKFGIVGIIAAIVCFPCGLICLFADTEKRCVRCGSLVG